jgi:hypothetical protein
VFFRTQFCWFILDKDERIQLQKVKKLQSENLQIEGREIMFGQVSIGARVTIQRSETHNQKNEQVFPHIDEKAHNRLLTQAKCWGDTLISKNALSPERAANGKR